MISLFYIQILLLLSVLVLHSAQPPSEQNPAGPSDLGHPLQFGSILLPDSASPSAIMDPWLFSNSTGFSELSTALHLSDEIKAQALGTVSVSSDTAMRTLSQHPKAVQSRELRTEIRNSCCGDDIQKKKWAVDYDARIKRAQRERDKRRTDMSHLLKKIKEKAEPEGGESEMTWSDAFSSVKDSFDEGLSQKLETLVAEALAKKVIERVQIEMEKPVNAAVLTEVGDPTACTVKEKVAAMLKKTKKDLIREEVSAQMGGKKTERDLIHEGTPTSHLGKEDKRGKDKRMHSQESSDKKRCKKNSDAQKVDDSVQRAVKVLQALVNTAKEHVKQDREDLREEVLKCQFQKVKKRSEDKRGRKRVKKRSARVLCSSGSDDLDIDGLVMDNSFMGEEIPVSGLSTYPLLSIGADEIFLDIALDPALWSATDELAVQQGSATGE
ncbi:MAG: hypothetical protein OXC30_03925 [Alphaproteobacteria bacterium]|nr:hypothetical protein [Alphaproteobacteria bacterium]